MLKKLLLPVLAVLVVACAASDQARERDRFDEMAIYERHAGAAETWVRFTNIRSWQAVGYHSVVLELGGSRHYLVKLIGACDLELDSGITMRLITSRRNVLSDFDTIEVGGQPCQIQSIHRLDYDAVQAELEAEGVSAPDEQDAVSVESEDGDQSAGGM